MNDATDPIIIELTRRQMQALEPLFSRLEHGGCISAQIFLDGTKVRLFDPATTVRIRKAVRGNDAIPVYRSRLSDPAP